MCGTPYLRRDAPRLGAFAGADWSQQDQVERMALGQRPMKPR